LRLIIISLATVVALAACTEQAPPAAPAGDTPAPAPSAAAPTTPATPPATNEPANPGPADACGAAERQDWVGRARSSLPSAPAGAVWRIYETGQPVTMDFNAARLNIEINPDTQNVVRLSCG
jgi:hypothetical protein